MLAQYRTLALGVASALVLSIGAAGAQGLGDAVGGVTGAVGDVTGSVSDTVGGVTGSVSDTVGGVTGSVTGDVDGTVGDVGQVGEAAQFSNVLDLVNQGGAAIGDVGQISQVQVVDLENVADFDAATLNDAVSQNSLQVAQLQDTLNSNQALSNAFNDAGVDVSDIVAIDASDSGNVTVYTSDDR